MKRKIKAAEIRHRGSLMTYRNKGGECCLGYLFEFPGKGIFEPHFGRINVSSAEAKTHNQLLSAGEIQRLDSNCAIALGRRFYLRQHANKLVVSTWLDEVVSRDVQIQGRSIVFRRKG